MIGAPGLEKVSSVWEKDAVVIGFASFKNLKELHGNLWLFRDGLVGRASKDKEHVPTFYELFVTLCIVVAATVFYWWEHAFIISLSTAVEDSDDEAVLKIAKRSEFCL